MSRVINHHDFSLCPPAVKYIMNSKGLLLDEELEEEKTDFVVTQ